MSRKLISKAAVVGSSTWILLAATECGRSEMTAALAQQKGLKARTAAAAQWSGQLLHCSSVVHAQQAAATLLIPRLHTASQFIKLEAFSLVALGLLLYRPVAFCLQQRQHASCSRKELCAWQVAAAETPAHLLCGAVLVLRPCHCC